MLIKKTNSVIRLALLGAVLMSGTLGHKCRRRPKTKPSETLRGRQALKGKIQARLREPAGASKGSSGDPTARTASATRKSHGSGSSSDALHDGNPKCRTDSRDSHTYSG